MGDIKVNENVNLKKLLTEDKIKKGAQVLKVPIKAPNGDKFNGKTYMIPLEYLYYNNKNGRISSAISKYESEHGSINPGHNEAYNTAIQNMIKDGDDNMDKLVEDMKNKGQEVPGYVLNDGRVVDGNRRFTATRIMSKDPAVSGTQYFEAVILDGLSIQDSRDLALIKQLELRIQFGLQKREDYDPIDKAVDAYKTIKIEKSMSISDYALYSDSKKNDVVKLINEAELIVEFLRFINADETNYFIAKDMKLDGPIQDMLPQYRSVIKKSEYKEEILSALFSKIIQLRSSGGEDDFKQDFRSIIKKVIGKGQEREFIEKTEDDADIIGMALSQDSDGSSRKTANVDDLYKKINNNDDAIKSLSNVADKSTEILNKMENEKKRSEPKKLVSEAVAKLEAIDVDTLNYISDEEKKHIRNNLRIIQTSINYIEEKM